MPFPCGGPSAGQGRIWTQIEISRGTAQNVEDYSRISKCLRQLNIFGRRAAAFQAPTAEHACHFVGLFLRFLKPDLGKCVKHFPLPVPDVNVSIYTKIKIAPFAGDIFTPEYSAAGGTKGADPRESPFMGEVRLVKGVFTRHFCKALVKMQVIKPR